MARGKGREPARAPAKVSGRVARHDLSKARRRTLLWAAPAGAITILVLAVVLAPPPAAPGGPAACQSYQAGQEACDFTVSLVNRQATFNLVQAEGPYLIEFMGSHCTTCEAQMGSLTKVVSKYRPAGLTVVSLDVGGVLGTEDPRDAVAFMADNGGDWDIALDNDAIAIDYGVVTLPTIFLVDAQGKIAFRTGYISEADLSAQVEALL